MKIVSFTDQCHNASTENLCRSYKNLRRREAEIQAQLEAIRQELTNRGFLPSKEEILKIYEEHHDHKS